MLGIMRYAGAIVCALLFALLAAAMLAGATLPFDEAARGAVHGLASARLTELARLFSLVGEAFVWVPMTMIAATALWLTARRKQALLLALAMLGAVVLDNGFKLAFHRVRPAAYFGPLPPTYSFPSGHALFAVCFYGALASILTAETQNAALRTTVWTAAVLLALSIGLSRIYLGVHYPSDVLAGYLAGVGWLAALCGAGTFRFRQNLSPTESRPRLQRKS
jgi:undecaprenyl-diphosphatase